MSTHTKAIIVLIIIGLYFFILYKLFGFIAIPLGFLIPLVLVLIYEVVYDTIKDMES